MDSEHTAVTVRAPLKEPSGDDRQVTREWKCRLVKIHGGCLEEALERALPLGSGYVKYEVFCLRQWFLICDSKTQVAKEYISTLDFIRIKHVSISKETKKKVKRQHA